MNEQLQIELIKVVTKINNGTGTAWDFLKEQTPDVIQQLLLWYGIKSAIIFFIFAISFFAFGIGFYKFIKVGFKEEKDVDYWMPGLIILMVFGLLITIFSVEQINLTWLQICIAPKVWLVEYITKIAI